MNVYDFDKTIYDGDSSVDFYFFMILKKPVLLSLLPQQLYTFILYKFKLIKKEKLKESFFSFLKHFDNIDPYVNQFWQLRRKKIKAFYLKNQLPTDLIISASPYFLLKPICTNLKVKNLIASEIDKKTGKFKGKNCHGKEKVIRFNKEFKGCEINKFYSDSLDDLPLFKISKEPYLVKKNKITSLKTSNKNNIKKLINLFYNKNFIIFILCGGMGTITNIIVSIIVSNYINATLSYLVGYTFSLFVTYYLNIKYNFYRKANSKEFIKFVISYIPNFIILFSFVAIFINILDVNKIIVYGLAGLLGIPITYALIKIFAFVKEKKDE